MTVGFNSLRAIIIAGGEFTRAIPRGESKKKENNVNARLSTFNSLFINALGLRWDKWLLVLDRCPSDFRYRRHVRARARIAASR